VKPTRLGFYPSGVTPMKISSAAVDVCATWTSPAMILLRRNPRHTFPRNYWLPNSRP